MESLKVGGHGYVDMKKSIVESANPYYYRLSDQIGHKPIVDTARLFGFNERTGIDIPGEKKGLLPDANGKRRQWEVDGTRETLYFYQLGRGILQ